MIWWLALVAYVVIARWVYERIVWSVRRDFPALPFTSFDRTMCIFFAAVWPIGYPAILVASSEANDKEIYPPLERK